MRAVLSHAPGGPDTLVVGDVPEPRPGPGQIRIAVKAVGINYPDTLIIADRYQFKPPRPFSPGMEASGLVDAVGAGVTAFQVGDRVMATTGSGALAEKVLAAAERCAPMPAGMPFDEGAAFLLTYATSHHALVDRARLVAGETLLVLGAAGGVGLAAIELGKAFGARVVAAASSREKVDFALEAGADDGIVYPEGPFDDAGRKALAASFKTVCGPSGADVVYDPVGGDYAEAALRAIAWKGRFLVVGFPAGIPRIPLNLTLLKGCDIVGVFWGSFVEHEPERHASSLRELAALYEAGRIHPRIVERFPLERAGDALATLAARRAKGKIVVTVP